MRRFCLWIGLIGALLAAFATYKSSEHHDEGTIVSEMTYWPEIVNSERNRTQIGTENACIYMLVRNWELHEALQSIRKIEDRFNRKFRYPWVFLNDEYFTDEFKTLTAGMVSGHSYYGHIEPEVWGVPSHINQTKMDECIEEMTANEVIYGFSRSYRNMCRFNSGNFFWHPLMLKYDYYWRVEPGIELYCDQRYDPFKFMRENNKVYGFVITITEIKETAMSLYKTFRDFLIQNPDVIAPDNGLGFLTDTSVQRPWLDPRESMEDVDGWNLCHFWSNFEIGSLNFFRSEAYSKYFNFLDQSGGFHYERWGDAPVHSMGVLALANVSQIHHFGDIGYYHLPFYRCPHDEASFTSGRCLCPENADENVDFQFWSCLSKWWKHAGRPLMFYDTGGDLFG